MDIFRDLDVLGGAGNAIEDEIEMLKSRSNLIELVRELELNTKIIALGWILRIALANRLLNGT